jgi:DNA-binding IclR family transcriptional regulator
VTATHSLHLEQRIQGEFREMPGLKLSLAQAQRLFGLGTTECEELLRTLNETGFLARTRDGSYVLASTAR